MSAPLVAFVVTWYPSHIYQSMGLARRLQSRGYRVEYWGHPASEALIRSNGFEFGILKGMWPWYETLLGRDGAARADGLLRDLRRMLARRRNRLRTLPDELARFEQSLNQRISCATPQLVVLDPFALTYAGFLLQRGISCVVLGDKPVPAADPLVPPPTCSLVPRDTYAGRLNIALAWLYQNAADHAVRLGNRMLARLGAYTSEHLLAAVRERTGLPGALDRVHRGPPYDLHFRCVSEWVLNAPMSDFPRSGPLPENVRYIGPCVDFARREALSPVQRDPSRKYFVYISMGTAMSRWDADLDLLKRIVTAFDELSDVQVAIAAGSQEVLNALGPLPGHIQAWRFLPQLALLQQADLAITHGGANAIRECIRTCTPMLVFPRGFDQPGNAARAIYHGVGRMGSRRRDSAAAIRRKALQLLQDHRIPQRLRSLDRSIEEAEDGLLDTALASARPAHVPVH